MKVYRGVANFLHILGVSLFSWTRYICSFIEGDGAHELLKFNQNRKGRFRQNLNFVFEGTCEGLLLLELKYLYSPGTDQR
jgi:hypothetical protein